MLDSVKEKEYINRIKEHGDAEAFRNIFHAYKEMVANLCYKFLGRDENINDVIQKAFIEIYKSLSNFEEKSELKTWIYRVTANTCYKEIRQKGVFRKFFESGQDKVDLFEDSSVFANPEKVASEEELHRTVQDALQELTPEKRMVLVMHDMEGCTHEDIAKITGESTGTIKSRLFYARKELARKLKSVVKDL